MTPEQAHCAAVAAEIVAVNGPCRLHPAMDYEQARAAVAEVIERERAAARVEMAAELTAKPSL